MSSVPAEGGSVSPASGKFDEDDEVHLQATANQDWVFDGCQVKKPAKIKTQAGRLRHL